MSWPLGVLHLDTFLHVLGAHIHRLDVVDVDHSLLLGAVDDDHSLLHTDGIVVAVVVHNEASVPVGDEHTLEHARNP